MPNAGGSATMYGVLYQILGTVHWSAKIRMRVNSRGSDLRDVGLHIEPLGGGGDLRIETESCGIVEQWKARSDGGTWSLAELIDEVLPDLFRAVDASALDSPAIYRFVSEGRRGRWGDAQKFFESLRGRPIPAQPLIELEDSESLHRVGDSQLTNRGLFHLIAQRLNDGTESIEQSYRRLWHLLSQFEMTESLSAARLRSDVLKLLLAVVDDRDQVDAKLNELCGVVLGMGSQGDVVITAAQLLEKVGLTAKPLSDWLGWRQRCRAYVQRHIGLEWRFNPDANVRCAPVWRENKPVLVLSGESGQGKTWQLAQLALEDFDDVGVATTVSASGDAERDVTAAVNRIWQSALGHESQLTVESLIRRCRDTAPKLVEPWLTVFIDDVLSMEEARRLVMMDWEGWGARLVVTTLPPIAQALKSQRPERVSVIDVADFSVSELQEFLRRRGHEWGLLPPDVRHRLRRPILASLFCDLANPAGWTPKNEYELFERYWLRIRDARDQADHHEDLARMRIVAGRILAADAVYPWTQDDLDAASVSSDVVRRLESIGWLRRLPDGRVDVPHDRLLNWAVSEFLVSQRKNNRISTDDLRSTVVDCLQPGRQRAGRFLGYVPLDVLWLMADEANGLRAEIPSLLEGIENAGPMVGYPTGLYEKLLPTLGARIIAAMIERVRQTAGRDFNPYPKLVAKAIWEIGSKNPSAVADLGRTLIREELPEIQETALRILTRFPHHEVLDDLWKLHIAGLQEQDDQDGSGSRLPYKLTFAALKACIQRDPAWLSMCIERSNPQLEPISELAWLVCNLDGDSANQVWSQAKATLFAKVSQDKPRCLSRCIARFRDATEIPRLEQWATSQTDFVAPNALYALAVIDPKLALSNLANVPPAFLPLTCKWWLPRLMISCRQATRDEIGRLIRDSDHPSGVAQIYDDFANLMDVETLEFLLNDLDRLAADQLAATETCANSALWNSLSLLAQINKLELLRHLQTKVGSSLEQRLTQIGCQWVGRASSYLNDEVHHLRDVLLKICGTGFRTLVNAMLSASSKHCRLEGIRWSSASADQETRSLLIAITKSDEIWEDQFPLLQLEATVALADLEENAAVVDSIMKWGTALNQLWDLRRAKLPMTDNDLASVFQELRSADELYRAGAMWAISVSGRRDLANIACEALRAASPESGLARAATKALVELRESSDEAISLFARQLKAGQHEDLAVIGLLQAGTTQATKILTDLLESRGIIPGNATSDVLAINLSRRADTRRVVAEAVWKRIQSDEFHFAYHDLQECLGHLDVPGVRDHLFQEAYASEDTFHVVGQRAAAIEALANHDRDAAFRAAELNLRMSSKEREQLPELLIEFDEERAIPVLCSVAVEERSSLVRWSIGRALRTTTQRQLTESHITRLLRSSIPSERQVGAELAGWRASDQFSTSLKELALNDLDYEVRTAAESAVLRRLQNDEALELLTAARAAVGLECWTLLESFFELADPLLVQDRGDPFRLRDCMKNCSAGQRLHIQDHNEQRIKDLKKQADDLDKSNESEF